MKDEPIWPALRPVQTPTGTQVCRRAVWGKVHGANSDFRWIARSQGFKADDGITRELLLGSEDAPSVKKMYFWRPVSNAGKITAYLAGTAYLSRAVDAAGRRGFLEKQLLELDADCPAAAMALLGLPTMAAWSDDIWWSQSQSLDWSKHRTVLPISEQILPTANLAQAVEIGLNALDALDPEALQHFYACLLAGEHPACLRLFEPLPPEALAALLLPLHRSVADKLSLAGWIPSRRYERDELGKRWDIIILPESASLPTLSAQALEKMEDARLCVQALQYRNPELLPNLPTEDLENGGNVPMPSIPSEEKDADTAVASNCHSGTDSTEDAADEASPLPDEYHLNDEDWPILPGARLALSPPTDDANEFMRLFHTVAATVDQRVFKINKDTVLQLSEADKRQLCLWVTQVKKSPRPHYADPDQWRLKLDLLCALAWILAPTACLQEKLPVPACKSFLFYATKLITDAQEFECWHSIIGSKPELTKILNDCKSNPETVQQLRFWWDQFRPLKRELY